MLIILGAGSCGRTALSIALPQWLHCEFLDDDLQGQTVNGAWVVGPIEDAFIPAPCENLAYVVAFGNQNMRERRDVFARLRRVKPVATLIHQSVYRAHGTLVGTGSIISPGCIMQPEASIGDNCFICGLVNVDHDTRIGDNACIGPGAVFCGGVTVGQGVVIGAGAIILPRRFIGRGAIVGAGAVITRDVPDFATVVGNPARIIRQGDPW